VRNEGEEFIVLLFHKAGLRLPLKAQKRQRGVLEQFKSFQKSAFQI